MVSDNGGTTSSGGPEAQTPGAGGGREAGGGAGNASAGAAGSSQPGDGRDSADSGSGRTGSRQGGSAWSGPLADIQETVTEIVDTALRGLGGGVMGGRFPRYDMVRLPEEGYRFYMDLSGIARENVEVTTVGDELTVSGQRRRPDLPEGSEVLRSERPYGRFRRSIRMPADVDPAGVTARLDAGVLILTLPRRTESTSHRVEVEN